MQATHGPDSKWDHHSGLITGLPQSCAEIDKPVAGLIRDLKSRGLLDETLVLWGGEFGRTPGAEHGARNGRDHNPHGYTMFMAGGGVKPGFSHGATDDYGYYAVEDKVHIHDLARHHSGTSWGSITSASPTSRRGVISASPTSPESSSTT